MGFAKLYGKSYFMNSDDFYDPWYDRYIFRYFPDELRERFADHIQAHPLKREIIITEIMNEIVNQGGLVFFQRMVMTTGKSLTEIAHAYLYLSEFLNLDQIMAAIETDGKWLNTIIHYEFLDLLQEKVFQITKKLLENSQLMAHIEEGDSKVFDEVLKKAAEYSTYRLPRKLRMNTPTLSESNRKKVTAVFRTLDILEDAFAIYLNHQINRRQWNIFEYFEVIERYRIQELRKILNDFKPLTGWEIMFLSKIDTSIEALLATIIEHRATSNSKEMTQKRQMINNMINEIIRLHQNGSLTSAAFYEMLQFTNIRITQ
jgi:NAD-specific glutamate dehydrogenase